jgi:hypothetical protein
MDVLVIVPFIISRYATLQYIDFILMLRLSRVVHIFQNLEEILNLRAKFSAILDVSKLISSFMFSSHLVACVWFFIGSQEEA